MNDPVNHIVQSLRVEASAQHPSETDAVFNTLSRLPFESMIDKALAGFEFPGERIRIDTIEVDAGILDLSDDLEIERHLQDCIRQAIQNTLVGYLPGQAPEVFSFPDGITDKDLSPQEEWEALNHYLQTGTLPWYAVNRFNIRQFTGKQIDEGRVAFITRLKGMRMDDFAVQRLWHLLPEGFFESLSYPEIPEEAGDFFNMVHLPLAGVWRRVSASRAKDFAGSIGLGLLRLVLSDHSMRAVQAFYTEWLSAFGRYIQNEGGPNAAVLKAELLQLQEIVFSRVGESIIVNTIRQAVERMTLLVGHHKLFELNAPVAAKQGSANPGNEAGGSPADEQAAGKTGNLPEMENEQQQWYITHAGLVLLNAGMLSRCFTDFGWVQQGRIVNDEAANSMRLWLHYLVWGDNPAAEYDLLLGKLLTGTDPAEPVALQAMLEPHHYAEGDALLSAVIEHWAQLKQTSIDGLRTGFLQRNGVVREDPSGFQLYAETRPQDILLNYLPWPYSIIKFPWMQKPLFTQWNTDI